MAAYEATGGANPDWLNKGDNAWQMTSATLVGLQSVPGLVILYGSIVKKKWAVNSAFMALYAFAAVLICWVTWAYKMSFGEKLLPFWGKAGPALGQKFLLKQAAIPASTHYHANGDLETAMATPWYPMASMVYFHCMFAAITPILLAGSVLGRMNFKAWMMFVPLWLTFSYTVGAFSMWGGGFLFQWGVMDYAGGYVIHLSSGTAGFITAYWVGPRLKKDRERFPPNNVLLTLAGAGLLWMGWAGFNGGDPYAANITASMAVLNTNICAATSLVVWTALDVIFFNKPSVIGAVQGMITGLVVITPAAGLVQGWAAIVMGVLAGSVPWFTMMIVDKRWRLLTAVDDTLGVVHTHAVAGFLGGILTGIFAEPQLCALFLPATNSRGVAYGGIQVFKQIVAALFIIGWNIVVTSIICVAIRFVVPLRMPEEQLLIGDDAVHGEEAYALWGDGELYDETKHDKHYSENGKFASSGATQAV
ncbi:putative ammonium transporter, blood group Rhesus C/E/D polypeptide, ammonium/urea transporter [Rosa chinensis]|uniref:Ammonium transporter n=1 Tax=Rosa chinensis TaxID=74649 RepID=A0A2P6REU2_ROSCH|nr:ammonium transporter 3 member 1 [Rosa chinensis]PRQ44935.1 putative ammonium transporter, blood group Rhesus C/E/D polypeptide, ammonium/urea transporter [Rosa chinensis]